MPQNLTFGRRVTAGLAALSLLGAIGLAASPAQAYVWTEKQLAAHQRYLACKTRLQRDPPCTQNWTRYCARQCRAVFW
jgi:hypothetical protein